MPEFPEVETVRRDLEARVIGRTITSCWISENAPRLVQLITRESFCESLTGRTIKSCSSRRSAASFA